jgi:hypothetical protein
MIFEDYLPYFAYVQGDTTAAIIDALFWSLWCRSGVTYSNMPFSFGIN